MIIIVLSAYAHSKIYDEVVKQLTDVVKQFRQVSALCNVSTFVYF